MKRILFLFTASLLLVACSSNNDNPQPEEQNVLKIKKLSKVFYVEDGKLQETISYSIEPLNGNVTDAIIYNEDLVTSIHYEYARAPGSTEDDIYEYDNRKNPLFENFNSNINSYIYNFTENMKSFNTDFS